MRELPQREIDVFVRSGALVAKRFADLFRREWSRIADEWQSIADEALVRAAHAYEPSQKTPFPAFAKRFILGAMYDHVQAEVREVDREVVAARMASLLGMETDRLLPMDWAAYDESPAEVRTRAARERRLRVQRMAAAALMVGDDPIDPEKQFLDREEIQHAVDTMNRVLAETPREQRDAYRLHAIQRKDQPEVAALLGFSVRSVQRYLAEFERRMKKGLVDAGIEPGPNVERAWFHFVQTVGEAGD